MGFAGPVADDASGNRLLWRWSSFEREMIIGLASWCWHQRDSCYLANGSLLMPWTLVPTSCALSLASQCTFFLFQQHFGRTTCPVLSLAPPGLVRSDTGAVMYPLFLTVRHDSWGLISCYYHASDRILQLVVQLIKMKRKKPLEHVLSNFCEPLT